MLTDPDVLAINQDKAAVQAVRVGAAGTTETWVKRLADGSRAVVLLNRGDSAQTLTTTASAVGLHGSRFTLKNAWTNKVTESGGVISAAVPAHGTALFRVEPARGVPGVPHVTAGNPQVTKVGTDVQPSDVAPVVAGGDELTVQVAVRNDGTLPVLQPTATVAGGTGWTIRPLSKAPALIAPGKQATFGFTVKLPPGAAPGSASLTATTTYHTVWYGLQTQTTVSPVLVAPEPPSGSVPLSHHQWITATSGWMSPTIDESVGGGNPIKLTGTTYPTGIGVASPSLIRYYLGKACSRLTGTVGIDDVVSNVGPDGGTSTFQVVGDGKVLFDSGVVDRFTPKQVDVDLTGVRVLDLVVGDAGDGGYNDRADWAAPTATC
jgi:alpha-galactosidase